MMYSHFWWEAGRVKVLRRRDRSQPVFLRAWAETLGIKNTRLLCDFWPHGEVAGLYSIFREKEGFSERANTMIDETQKVVFFKVYEIRVLPDIHEIVDFLKSMNRT